ncbi:hypothetical protein OS493_013645 [Desmophyllum pertusum]|uniref:Uncharacterized protein n=1 Tax=Desmophyllum pertusum TaxID=174260 RepID=A0A9X0A2K0_9CNID|nr:hypothetical protein OS493_013645 [Desmophyllum pertusum]
MGKELSTVDTVKDLGVVLDSQLSFNEHIGILVPDLMGKLSMINRIRHLLDQPTLLMVINSLVLSKLLYCSSVWSGTRTSVHLSVAEISSAFKNRSLFLRTHDVLVENTLRPTDKSENSAASCKLPNLDPFHSSVIKFIKDLGKLRCEGASYSSFENNVLRVEGEGIASAQYRKIERTPGDDFGVVLSDAVRVQKGEHKGVFTGNATVDADFIRVDVVTSSGETKSDVHMHVFPKKEVLERQPKPVVFH